MYTAVLTVVHACPREIIGLNYARAQFKCTHKNAHISTTLRYTYRLELLTYFAAKLDDEVCQLYKLK